MVEQNIQTVSVLVPKSPFVREKELRDVTHCLAALNVAKLMDWWPGQPHVPHRDPEKVRSIQRSLDWKRVAQIAAYLLQEEITDAPNKLDRYFGAIYEPTRLEPGREWPPKVPRVVGFERSEYPTFSNVLLHVNGAKIVPIQEGAGAANLVFDASSADLKFSVIDGQHRINGAYLAVCLLSETEPGAALEIPAEIFLDLDKNGQPPRRQAQIFIDVNFYQKKVDRSLVADLFPTARGRRGPLDNKERAQDIGRRLMLDTGPLVGMVQIPGIKFGVKDVVTLATLNRAIEDSLDDLNQAGLDSLDDQTRFISQCLDAWLEATGRKEELTGSERLDPENVAYQGRVVVSFLTLIPGCLITLRHLPNYISEDAHAATVKWLRRVMKRAGLQENGRFLSKTEFREKGFLGSGGLARFRDTLWAAGFGRTDISALSPEDVAEVAEERRAHARAQLAGQ
jgi:DGQHR domain-containing protein